MQRRCHRGLHSLTSTSCWSCPEAPTVPAAQPQWNLPAPMAGGDCGGLSGRPAGMVSRGPYLGGHPGEGADMGLLGPLGQAGGPGAVPCVTAGAAAGCPGPLSRGYTCMPPCLALCSGPSEPLVSPAALQQAPGSTLEQLQCLPVAGIPRLFCGPWTCRGTMCCGGACHLLLGMLPWVAPALSPVHMDFYVWRAGFLQLVDGGVEGCCMWWGEGGGCVHRGGKEAGWGAFCCFNKVCIVSHTCVS